MTTRAPNARLFRRAVGGSTSGTAAVEFAIFAPVFSLLLAVAIDFGGVLYTKFTLDGAVSAASNYALINAASVTSTGGAALATNLAAIVAGAPLNTATSATIVVDNGPSTTIFSGVATPSGSALSADLCYCPTRPSAGLVWGAAAICGSSCANGSLAGKYVSIVVSRTYKPFFSSYGIVKNGAVTASAVAATQ